jgi:hypothetical protein
MARGKNRHPKRHLRLIKQDESFDFSGQDDIEKFNSAFEIGEENVHTLFRSLKKMINPDQELIWRHPGLSGKLETKTGSEKIHHNLDDPDHLGHRLIHGIKADDLIFQKVYETLMRSHEIDATQIGIKVSHGIVFLTGKVTSRWMKKMSKRMIENLPGVREVKNELTVVPSHDNPRGPDSAARKDLGIS